MAQLTRAHQELFRRSDDERFSSLADLSAHCRSLRERSQELWERPQELLFTSDMTLALGDNPDLRLNDWSFGQVCRIAGFSRETINRLSPKTASRALQETLPAKGQTG